MIQQNDLINRTSIFSKSVIDLCKLINRNLVNQKILDQLLRSSFSIGANYREANETETKKDFIYKMRITRREAKETLYWLELLLHANPGRESEIKFLLNESEQLLKITSKIVQNVVNKI